MKGSFVRNTLAACTLAFAAAGAQAAIVNTWDYTISLAWSVGSTEWSGGGGSQTEAATELSWGQTGGSHTVPGGDRSALIITDTPKVGVATTVVTGDPLVSSPSGSITHYNNVLSGTFATLEKAKLVAKVSLTPKTPTPGDEEAFDYSFDIFFIETPNTEGSCLEDANSVCDDVFVIAAEALNQSFTYDNQTYYVSIFEASNKLKSLLPDACGAAGSEHPCLGFLTEENKATTANFAFSITTDPVKPCEGDDCNPSIPEPGTLVLMGLGLVGLRSLRRRS